MTGIKIIGTGAFVPEKTVDNNDFTKIVETSDEWIRTRTGMDVRHISTHEATWYMGAAAASQALEAAGADPASIDMVIVTTVTGEYITPSTACLIQGYIGAVNAFALDLSVACTGMAFSLDMARRYLQTGMKRILVVAAESLSQITNYEDRATCVLFGDGAGAALVEAGDGCYGSFCRSDASGVQYIYAKKTRRTHPLSPEALEDRHESFSPAFYDALFMAGQPVYKFATKAMPLAVEKACEAAGITAADLDLVIPHQANLRIIETAMKNLRLPMDKVHVTIHKYGNTSSATIAIGLNECVREGRLRRGDKVCLVGMGAGLTYGATAFEY